MTKELYPAPARIKITCRVTSIRNGRKYSSEEVGTNSMLNASRDYKEKIQNAKLNAIYKHMNRGGGSDATVQVIDYDIVYFTKQVRIVKEIKSYKNKQGKIQKQTYAYAVDKNTGKRVNRARIVKKSTINDLE
jgi:hypothetical protein